MSNTCGECKYYKPYNEKICRYVHRQCVPQKTKACSNFASVTVFDHVTQSMEVLAEKSVYFDCSVCDGDGIGYPWCSTLFADGGHFATREKAKAATIEKLKKEYKGNVHK